MQVDDKARQDAGRGCGHKHVRRLLLAGRKRQVREVALQRAAVLVAQGADAAGKRRVGEIPAPVGEVRVRQQVAADHDVAALFGGARVRRHAGDAMPDIGRVGRLAHLAVADHVDAGRDLLRDDIVDRLGDLRFESGRVDGVALFLAQHEVDQRLRPRQAAGVGGEDAVCAEFHAGVRNLPAKPSTPRCRAITRKVRSRRAAWASGQWRKRCGLSI